jgi:hypothetical protein
VAESITNVASTVVSQLPHLFGSNTQLQFESRGGILIVSGYVPSFFLKQVLHRALLRIEGVERLEDRVRVVYCAHHRHTEAAVCQES